jgi:two-component system NtrC family sensor kinase
VRPCLPPGAPSSDIAARLQRELWGLDQSAIARRLAVGWRLPPWLTAIAGHLGMPLDVARTMGADPEGFQVVQLAVTLVEQAGHGLHLPVGASRDDLARALDLSAADIQHVLDQILERLPWIVPPKDWRSPSPSPGGASLLPDVLRLAADNRKLIGAPIQDRLHADLDALHEATRKQYADQEKQLHKRKLAALAELAAGAGHEINNPLAVISGQAQYLLTGEQEPSRKKALQTIIGQTQRIHQTLTQLMQFARPSAPHKQRLDLGGLLREVISSLQPLADDRQVRVLCTEPDQALTLLVDPGQIRTTLVALLRNAIEASPASGWASVRIEARPGLGLMVVVEDNGPGPSVLDREHLFDPFYSGRKAGRGRGLGLPTAWQLSRQHGGDLTFDAATTSPTRFVLTLPAEVIADPLPSALEVGGLNGCHLPLPSGLGEVLLKTAQ